MKKGNHTPIKVMKRNKLLNGKDWILIVSMKNHKIHNSD